VPELQDGEHRIPPAAPVRRLDRVLRELFPRSSWNALRKLVTTGKVSVDGRTQTDPAASVAGGSTVALRLATPRPRAEPRLPRDRLIHADGHLVVVDKPAGVSSVPFEEGERDALTDLARALLAEREGKLRAPLGVVHRLDRATSGLIVLARTLAAKRELKQQFRFHTVRRRYLAVVSGRIGARTLHSRLVRDRGDGLRGSSDNPKLGRPATTHVRPKQLLAGATLIECALETGRTHQIRIHLAEAGHPVVGEKVYARGLPGDRLEAPRLMLHAAELGFVHPATGKRLSFTSPMPEDMRELVRRLAPR
jgi:23S rRNA pseudouridine1911/1915/1917 synthase